MDRRERERILREGGVGTASLVEDARQRHLSQDLDGSPLRGQPLRRRLRNFRPAVDSYVASLGGPLPYMQRLREIELRVGEHERRLGQLWQELRDAFATDAERFATRWRDVAARWSFDEVNDLIARHNRFFPAESRLPMDPATGDYVLVGGKRYDREQLDTTWILERFPPELDAAA
jgi:hypothetical protein